MTLRESDVEALNRCAFDGSLELRYLPEVELATSTIVALEGVLRWHHVDGELQAGQFLAVAEGAGSLLAINRWALSTGAVEAAQWQQLPGGGRQLWLNVSLADLRDPGFVPFVASLVDQCGLPHAALGLQVSEQTLQSLGASAGGILTDLHGAGVGLALDAVTSWWSSLEAGEVLPISAVKLDHRHVRGIDQPDGDIIGRAIIEAAHENGLYVVAQGVATWSEAERLTELGCDRAHGPLFGSEQRGDKARWLLTQGVGWRGGLVPPGMHAAPFPVPRAS